jgi:carbon storage regulator CsrA
VLILGRKPGERIVLDIGEIQIVVTMLEWKGNHARLGFDAPKDVLILREELADPGPRGNGDGHGGPQR